jgi:hypothetical protein
MKPSLENPKLKIERAKEHLDALDVALITFQNKKPFRVYGTENIDHTLYILRCEIPIIDPKLAILAGDAIYNLRSALDHIAWQLALTKVEKPKKRTAFPIIDVKTHEKMLTFDNITKDIPTDAIDQIRMLQPYIRGSAYSDDLLWKLDELCNIDKHRVIPAQGTAIDFKFPKELDYSKLTFDQRENAIMIGMPIAFKPQIQLAPEPTPDIVLGSRIDGLTISVRELAKMYMYILGHVLPKFERFFQE